MMDTNAAQQAPPSRTPAWGSEHGPRRWNAHLSEHLAALRHAGKPPRDVNREHAEEFSALDRLALAITTRVGTFGFFLLVLGWTVLCLGWNLVAPRGLRFDPAPAFVLWLFVSNLIQILLMPLIMVGQNLQGRHSELRAQSDFEINQKAEHEVETILLHLAEQAELIARQESLALEILRRIDARPDRNPQPPASAPAMAHGVG